MGPYGGAGLPFPRPSRKREGRLDCETMDIATVSRGVPVYSQLSLVLIMSTLRDGQAELTWPVD